MSDTRALADLASDWRQLRDLNVECTACALAVGRTQVVFAAGDAPADVMFVGEAPGMNEDLQGVPFVGRSGQLLDQLLGAAGIDRDQVVIANVVKCRPPDNRDPLPEEVETCRWWLRRQVHLVDPAVICTLGSFATRWALGKDARITRDRGRRFTVSGRTVVPTFHPAAALRSGPAGAQMAALRSDITLLAGIIAEVRTP
ncbi:MAG: uracil-DNA glycosylase [Frankiaceae bacterium]|jgi:DNA polymerase|nr:uracil-DNA glycosylase [Frankiaceae bacterium]